ncbi:SGNH/GDSL hydrolase family protein [Microbacterium sp.]|uniref:SGNH/GDSL hydrolase family protein n=1 Tax=Microbacterium sp. TaxID=51671 RepID=UPI0039E54212
MATPIVFIGDSITDAERRTDPAALGFGWVREVATALRAAGEERDIVNRGISGDRVVDLAARWADDVLALSPSLVTVYVGINDTWRRYDSDDATSTEDFENGYRALLATVADVPELVVVEPFLTPVTPEQETWYEDLDPKRAAVARLAEEFGAAFVPLHGILTEAAAAHGAAAIADDGVHPTALGVRLIADAWLARNPRQTR